MLSSLTLHGIQCGPLAFTQNADLIYLIFAILFVSNCLMLVIERAVLSGYLKILTAPRRIVMVMVIMMCFMGSYGARNNYADVFVFAIGGSIGYFMQMVGISRAPIILGYILGGIIEENLARGLSLSLGDYTRIFNRPIAMVFLGIAVISFVSSLRKSLRAQRKARIAEEEILK